MTREWMRRAEVAREWMKRVDMIREGMMLVYSRWPRSV